MVRFFHISLPSDSLSLLSNDFSTRPWRKGPPKKFQMGSLGQKKMHRCLGRKARLQKIEVTFGSSGLVYVCQTLILLVVLALWWNYVSVRRLHLSWYSKMSLIDAWKGPLGADKVTGQSPIGVCTGAVVPYTLSRKKSSLSELLCWKKGHKWPCGVFLSLCDSRVFQRFEWQQQHWDDLFSLVLHEATKAYFKKHMLAIYKLPSVSKTAKMHFSGIPLNR